VRRLDEGATLHRKNAPLLDLTLSYRQVGICVRGSAAVSNSGLFSAKYGCRIKFTYHGLT
jgi:hypothetical protein